jgi:arylsulfatase A
MNRRDFLKWTGSAAVAAMCAQVRPFDSAQGRPAAGQQGKRPNIIFILADDYGIGGVGCYGSDRFKTPTLDALAQTGIKFEYCFSMPLCAPSRGVCMMGRYPFRTGVVDNGSGSRAHPDKEVCIAKVMKQAGYATAVAGKWRQLSYFTTKQDALRWGFDEFLIWGVDMSKGSRYWDPDYNKNGQPLSDAQGKYGPDLLHEFVVDFIRRHQDQPFFIHYPMTLIHGPIQRTPDSPAEGANYYADNIAYLDKLVGKLVAELDRLNIREKTLIVFTGDNGCTPQASGAKGGNSGGTLNGRAIDGAKGSMKEGGSRVPLIVNWKGTTSAGQVSKNLVDFSDFFPTFAELAGAKLPADVTIDGHSFAPQLTGGSGKPRRWIFVQLGQQWYVRDARWKLNQAGDLFDMKDAPFREVLTQADSPETQAARAALQAALDALRPHDSGAATAAQRDKPKKKTGKRKKQK